VTPDKIHNRDAAKIVNSIIRPTIKAGGQYSSVLVLLESVIFGVLLFGDKLKIPPELMDRTAERLFDGVRRRIAEERLSRREPEGNA
jgi:hypothetical protein